MSSPPLDARGIQALLTAMQQRLVALEQENHDLKTQVGNLSRDLDFVAKTSSYNGQRVQLKIPLDAEFSNAAIQEQLRQSQRASNDFGRPIELQLGFSSDDITLAMNFILAKKETDEFLQRISQISGTVNYFVLGPHVTPNGSRYFNGVSLIKFAADPAVRDDALAALHNGLPNAHTISLKNCVHVTSPTIHRLLHSMTSGRLRMLDLSGIPSVTDDVFSAIMTTRGVNNLEILHLCECPGLSNMYTPHMVQGSLAELFLTSSPNVTDEGLKNVVKCCSALKRINLVGCNQISKDALLQYIPDLRKLQKYIINSSLLNEHPELRSIAKRI